MQQFVICMYVCQLYMQQFVICMYVCQLYMQQFVIHVCMYVCYKISYTCKIVCIIMYVCYSMQRLYTEVCRCMSLRDIYHYAIWSCVIIIISHSTIETFYSLCNSVLPVCCKLILLEDTLQLVLNNYGNPPLRLHR